MHSDTVRIANWNLEWAGISSRRGNIIRALLESHDPDIVCLTEAYSGFLQNGHIAEAEADYGYPLIRGRRKVSLWSRWPLLRIDRGKGLSFPSGRFVSAVIQAPMGELDLVGVCIPWRDAHVRTGNRNRVAWEDHIAFLEALRVHLTGRDRRTVVVGDFNQRVPPIGHPPVIVSALERAISPFLTIVTAGLHDERGSAAIDHLALTGDLVTTSISLLSAKDDGRRLSDHFGWVADVEVCNRVR